jgi:DNA polymerase-3 subunit epsilon
MFAPRIAFVDIETTGMAPNEDRITELAVVTVQAGVEVERWSTLVNPETAIPGAIQVLTGITGDMVARAPTFAQVAGELLARLAGHLFVAHNARFDYGFIKNEFARLGMSFSARVLCTVRLSRRLYPRLRGHGLDALIVRHGLQVAQRHRALGDAQALWQFTQALYREHPAQRVQAEVDRLLKLPSLPPQLPPDALSAIPEAPGVYLFYGLNQLPLYIGKSINLRQRVHRHFSADHRSAQDARLSGEIHRVDWEETAGELGALLREAQLIKTLLPLHNHRLRRKSETGSLRFDADDACPRFVPADELAAGELGECFGVFGSRHAARNALHRLAREHRLCLKRLGLERRSGPCFARQLQRCDGACVGAEEEAAHGLRVRAALAPLRLHAWPYQGAIGLPEVSVDRTRHTLHVFDQWCHLGSARDPADAWALLELRREHTIDFDVYAILARYLGAHAGLDHVDFPRLAECPAGSRDRS